jgi:type I restriction enzyme R subunit
LQRREDDGETSPHACTEDQLVEQPAIGLFAELGWTTVSELEVLQTLRRTRDLLLPRLLLGQVGLSHLTDT